MPALDATAGRAPEVALLAGIGVHHQKPPGVEDDGANEPALARSRRARRDAGDVAHLAAGPRLGLAVEVEAGVRLAGSLAQASAASPIRFSIIGVASGRARSPSGSPQMARMCCSNWPVEAAVLGPVAGIVHARRDLVDHAGRRRGDEELDASTPT